MTTKNIRTPFIVFAAALLVAALAAALAPGSHSNAAGGKLAANTELYGKAVPDVNPSLMASPLRQPTGLQLAALDNLKSNYGQQLGVRWNPFSGSPDVVTNFHTPPSADTPENTARAFVGANSALFGVSADSLALVSSKEALGGYLLRFQQRAGGVDVAGGGLGFVMNADKQIRMVMGSTYRDVNVSNATALDAATAAARAQAALAQYAVALPTTAAQYQTPALDELQKQIAPALRAPRLNVVPTADGYRMAWNVMTFSRNPFGMFVTQVDASTGDVLAREDLVRYQQDAALPYTADIFPNHPVLKNPDTGELKRDSFGVPEGLTRVQLRGYNPGTNATAVNGVLSGPHALIKNVLATQQPFAQAALGTFHFRQNNAPLEAQPNEADDLAEPAEHIDDVNIFFFINYLLEYVDDVHRRDDLFNNRVGQGSFPDTYPNSDRPLVGLPHFPNENGMLGAGGPIDTTNADTILHSTVGFDNAFSLPVIETVDTPAGPQTIVVNPTVYGHGYLLNDLGKDGAVCYHEGMHSLSTPIAGLEGAPEGGAMNEGQADLWAYTITDAEAIGEYGINGAGYRKLIASTGRDPNTLAWVRSARTSLKYSQLGTRFSGGAYSFEVHRDGEIYVGAMYDLRQLMIAAWPQKQFVRPAFGDGKPTRQISLGQEMWERIFLGSLYVLGTSSPDTFVRARDAMIAADRALYSSDPTNLDAPGQHEALIWQVFASHEIGLNAAAPLGGRQTISTAVPQFALDQPHGGAPQGVSLTPGNDLKSVTLAWQPVDGAYAYEVFKRRIGSVGQRQYKGAPGREYFDGDNQTTGWSHVGYVAGATSYTDNGAIAGAFRAAGINPTADANGFNQMFDSEYAVRAISINPTRQAGFGDLSASASLNYAFADVTNAIQTATSNLSFADGKLQFDQTVKNLGVAGADPSAYAPVEFQMVSILNPTVTAGNADNGGDGQSKPAIWAYNQSLATGQVSAPRRLVFYDPGGQSFDFYALVTARVRGASQTFNGSQGYDGDGGGRAPINLTSVTDTYTGIIVVGSAGNNLANGVDYVDVPFVAKEGAFGVEGTLDALPNATAAPDMDFQLLDDQGRVLATSGNLGPNESVGGGITPGRTYVYRVVGYANGPAQFTIKSEQFINLGAKSSTDDGTGSTVNGSGFLPQTSGVSTPTRLVRFSVNPLTKTVSARIVR